jgi:type I restriction enzyme R subunit
MNPDSETALELATIALCEQLGYTTANCRDEWEGGSSKLDRQNKTEVVLTSQLRPALQRLNPELPPEAINQAIATLTSSRRALSLASANREIYRHLKDGIKVTYNRDNRQTSETVRLIDWRNPANNRYFLASQLTIEGDIYTKRPDLLGFVNGIPLIFIELKAHTVALKEAYTKNFTDYKKTIPQLFWYNAAVILSNGSQAKIGSITAPWEKFGEWKRIDSEGETGRIDLETVIRGVCQPEKLLDLVENFTLFAEGSGGLTKIVARNHQYLGVDRAIASIENLPQNRGRLGVFWHTQGSGKSYSMQFFAQKVLRVLPGNWTFVVVCDRGDLDDQIYKNFAQTGAVTEPEASVRATSGEHLKQLLTEDHRYILTLIQKFRTAKGQTYPKLSDRNNIIVMADEAHRSQYDIYALNMRLALPNAAFIGFTGTPLMKGNDPPKSPLKRGTLTPKSALERETFSGPPLFKGGGGGIATDEITRQVFGEYVSVYNFRQSIEDGATVPLYYENRIPQLELLNEQLNDDIAGVIDSADLDEEAEDRLAREFAREYHLVTREERLEAIAADIVSHFLNRGFAGKAMVVCIDRFTAVKMYDKVRHYWQQELEKNRREAAAAEKIKYLEETDMAVVISASPNEEETFREKGLEILPHRQRFAKQKPSLDEQFKDPENPLRIVFVCAMWMTGFDVPSCSTVYLDKPMKNHALMQTIARANRVFLDKNNGLIVDYIGVFRDLQNALAIYGAASGGGVSAGDLPVQPKTELVESLREAIAQTAAFLKEKQIDLQEIENTADTFQRIEKFDDAREAILSSETSKQDYLLLSRKVAKLYKAILPDTAASEFSKKVGIVGAIAQNIRLLEPKPDISETKGEIEKILDSSVTTLEYEIPQDTAPIDLSQLDVSALEKRFKEGRQNTETERLKNAISAKLERLLKQNKSRANFYHKFQELIDKYNLASRNTEAFFAELIEFARELNREESRALAEGLDEEKLAIFDLLIRSELELTEKDKTAIKKVAEELLSELKQEKLALDWRNRQQETAAVRVIIDKVLDENLPEVYGGEIFELKCQELYEHIYENYGEVA